MTAHPHIALLRGINVGGHAKVAMADLRALAGSLGLADARTLLQSGNLVFRSSQHSTAALQTLLEDALAERFGERIDVLVRTAPEWSEAIAANPFPDEAAGDPSHVVLFALKEAPGKAALAALKDRIVGSEAIELRGRNAYITYPDGIGRSKLTSGVIESRLATRGTGRNWNTVLKIAELLRG